jgi:membrane dipeptidase
LTFPVPGKAGSVFASSPGGLPTLDDLIRNDQGYEVALAPPVDQASAFERCSDLVECLYRLEAESAGSLKVVRNRGELVRSLAHGVVAAVLHFEGASAVEADLGNLEGLYQKGMRSLGVTWSRKNAFGWGVPFKYPAGPDIGPGLTKAGRELVRACNSLGILVDLSHLNEKGFWDVAGLSQAPLVATHSGVHALSPRTRNLTDDQLAAIRDSNGIVGITFAVWDLRADGRLDTNAPLTEIVRHVAYVAEKFGIDHVAFGSDMDGARIPDEMGDVRGFPRLVQALRDHGFDDDAVRKIAHGNWLRVIGETWIE